MRWRLLTRWVCGVDCGVQAGALQNQNDNPERVTMNANPVTTGIGKRCVGTIVGLTLAMMLTAHGAGAQAQAAEQTAPGQAATVPARPPAPPRVEMYEMLTLKNMTEQRGMNDVQTALRNMLPRARIYAVQSRGSISLSGTADEIELARKIVAELDQPAKNYELTFTITDTDSGKQTGLQRLSMVIVPGARMVMKQGSRMHPRGPVKRRRDDPLPVRTELDRPYPIAVFQRPCHPLSALHVPHPSGLVTRRRDNLLAIRTELQ